MTCSRLHLPSQSSLSSCALHLAWSTSAGLSQLLPVNSVPLEGYCSIELPQFVLVIAPSVGSGPQSPDLKILFLSAGVVYRCENKSQASKEVCLLLTNSWVGFLLLQQKTAHSPICLGIIHGRRVLTKAQSCGFFARFGAQPGSCLRRKCWENLHDMVPYCLSPKKRSFTCVVPHSSLSGHKKLQTCCFCQC